MELLAAKKTNIRMSAKQRKAIIVEAVFSQADIEGPDRLSTATIAKASGLTHAGIFRHFATKQDIWNAVANEIVNRAQSHWERPLMAASKPRKKIENLISAHFDFLSQTPAILTILFSYELQRANEDLRFIFTKMMMQFRSYLANQFLLAGVKKSKSEDFAFLLIALIQGVAMRWSVSQRNFNLKKEGKRLLKLQLDMIFN